MKQVLRHTPPESAPIFRPDPPNSEENLTSYVPDDERFIRTALLNTPEQGVELLYRRYYQPLCNHAVRFVSSRQVAEDLVSDIFYQFYSEGTFRNIDTSYRAYLYKTVRNRAYNYLRWELSRNAPLDELRDTQTASVPQPDAITQYEELYQDVDGAIQSLPVQRRRIYLMHRFEGRKCQEIADELALSVRTVEVQVYRATQAIRQLLKDKWLLLLLFGTQL